MHPQGNARGVAGSHPFENSEPITALLIAIERDPASPSPLSSCAPSAATCILREMREGLQDLTRSKTVKQPLLVAIERDPATLRVGYVPCIPPLLRAQDDDSL